MATASVLVGIAIAGAETTLEIDGFNRPGTLYLGDGWETLNPGLWKIEDGALRRRLRNPGGWGGKPEFPFRFLLAGARDLTPPAPLPKPYPPALPFGMIWRRDWKLEGNFAVTIETTVKELPPPVGQTEDTPKYRPGYSLMGIGFGGQSPWESWSGGKAETGAWMALWRADGRFGLYTHATDAPDPVRPGAESDAPIFDAGDRVRISLAVTGGDPARATVTAVLRARRGEWTVRCENVDRAEFTNGYFGIVGRGLLDFEVNKIQLRPEKNTPIDAPVNALHVCYPLGDTLREVDGAWQCTFMALFRGPGREAVIRVAARPDPEGGWGAVSIAGRAPIVNNGFRRNTASIGVTLPQSPAETTLYYTVWKDGVDVTADPRTGLLGRKSYVGRLPRLRAPYRLCGLGGHAINGAADLPGTDRFQANYVHGQPTPDAFKHFEDYDFQILNWEDDVWYLELLLPPASVDDAYQIIALTIANPTTRWQMMRHWNTINPGDHDYGMNDLHGPESYIIRKYGHLGQDPEYTRRNYRIVQHLISGNEAPSGTEVTEYWRRWRMPDGDFSFLILDARSWRGSIDTALWVNYGWGHDDTLHERTDPMRVLLGERQFAWLQEVIRTDPAPLIAITGLNGLHTIWQGSDSFDPETGLNFNQRGRGAGDYAGWVKAGADRVLELLGSRQGIVTVYGDVHTASIMKNLKHGVYESSFGAIARNGSRRVKKGFARQMADYDLRPLEMIALYHAKFDSPDLTPNNGPRHWNFLEMEMDPRSADPAFALKIRNLIDAPSATPRGGGHVEAHASETGRPYTATLPPITTLPNADILFTTQDNRPIQGARSLANGKVPVTGLIEIGGADIPPGTRVLLHAYDGAQTESRVIETVPADPSAFRAQVSALEETVKAQYNRWVEDHEKENP